MPDPTSGLLFEWDEHNEEKLSDRGISPWDVEAVFRGEQVRPTFLRNKKSGTAQWMMIGRDLQGHLLKIGIVWADEASRTLRAITGWRLDK